MEGVEEIALPRTVSTVAVIGAEPSGLATARRLLEAGLNVTVFERKRKAGPIWYADIRVSGRQELAKGKVRENRLYNDEKSRRTTFPTSN